jgi:hypothetical protein
MTGEWRGEEENVFLFFFSDKTRKRVEEERVEFSLSLLYVVNRRVSVASPSLSLSFLINLYRTANRGINNNKSKSLTD